MKKALVAGILGIALNVASSYGQGYIAFASYTLVNGGNTPVYSGVTYGAGSGALTGKYVGAAQGWKADLLFSLDGGATFTLEPGSQTPFYINGGVPSQDGGSPTTDGAGVFAGPTLIIPGYTSGPVSFITEAYNGSSFGSSTFNGKSAVFTLSSLVTNPALPPSTILDNNDTTTINGMKSFTVAPVPEPSIFALAGLGAAGLMAFRRKK